MLEPLRKLFLKAPATTAYMLEQLQARLFPLIESHGFEIAPDYRRTTKNKFGLVWGINQVPFQDRSIASWPTIEIEIDRDLAPNFRVALCTIPQKPKMLRGDVLPRNEANVAHSTRCILLRKGRSRSYLDQHFGAAGCSILRKKRIDGELELCTSLMERILSKIDRDNFLNSTEKAIGETHVFELWNPATPHRPNHSA